MAVSLSVWPEEQKRTPDIFTKDDVCHAEFDFNRFAFHDNNISEKAFRHKLVQVRSRTTMLVTNTVILTTAKPLERITLQRF